jgi:glycosyltransferase involved in cell wall biosynthesis
LNSPPCPIYLLALRSSYDLAAVRGAFELRRFLKRERVRIVQTFFESSDIWAGFVTKALSKAKLIWARRDMGILRTRKHHIAYRLLAWAPDTVFAVSEQVRQYSIEVDRIEPARVQTIYNGLNLGDWNAAPRPAKAEGEFLIATVGNIRRVKGHDVFIRAAAKVAEQFPKARFSIAGSVLEPAFFAELQALVQELKLVEKFQFDGEVANPRQYLATADIFVLPAKVSPMRLSKPWRYRFRWSQQTWAGTRRPWKMESADSWFHRMSRQPWQRRSSGCSQIRRGGGRWDSRAGTWWRRNSRPRP